ncbi:hypothetical protein O3Q52_01755 [Streptomyces sp. ActVer]|uniref:hypothetical protein n=1 Tax=Streptomyces sp. ActVer TaxID=3014558 RepID=UPI0022B53590|nr:hypothetical protein [Streptomyces sp. ActVer]MCZ4506953.1 hypothetical protein [Streptomyces sp. ActVer]
MTACSSGDGKEDSGTKPDVATTPSQTKGKVDCGDESLSQADWAEHCSGESGTGGDGTEGQTTGLKFGESYTWPDGLKATVVEAKVFTDYDPDFESAEPGETDFRVKLQLENGSKAAVPLDDLSLIIEGTTNGGQAASTSFENGSEPLEGRLAAGRTVTKTDDNVLETKYGKKIVVTVQRSSENFDLEFPEFEGQITG